jgi:hypothetical protein
VSLPSVLNGYIYSDSVSAGDLGRINVDTGEPEVDVDHRAEPRVEGGGARVDLADLERATREVDGLSGVVGVKTPFGLGVGIMVEGRIDRTHLRATVRRRVDSVEPQVISAEYVGILDSAPASAQGVAYRHAVQAALVALRRMRPQYNAEQNAVDLAVADAVFKIAGAAMLSVDDEFVQLGVISIGLIQLAAKRVGLLGVTVAVRELRDVTTLRELTNKGRPRVRSQPV